MFSSQDPSYITFERLTASLWTNHVVHFTWLFEKFKVDSLLEFGLGEGTKFFLDHCKEVASIEMATRNAHERWYNQCLQLYQGYPHWKPVFHPCEPSLLEANEKIHKKVPVESCGYLYRLKELCDEWVGKDRYQVVFVDPGHYLRADLVNELFDRAPIIAAHDRNSSFYQWERVNVPAHYEELHFKEGKGTVFWIRKES